MSLRVGLLVNPIAGVGGPGAHKGSDNHWREALAEGTPPMAGTRAQRFVSATHDADWLTLPGAMGVPGLTTIAFPVKAIGETTAADTARGAQALRDAGIDLLCFVGGDGTAADVAAAVGSSVACLGIPAGVKITSPVFCHDPDEAGWLVSRLNPNFETVAKDVTDLDESAYREGRLDVSLRGSLRVPVSPVVQGGKVATVQETPLEPLVEHAMQSWDRDALHLVGAGSVCMALKQQFWGDPTLLGVDAIEGDRIVQSDLNADEIDALVASHPNVHLWLSIIGGQGMLLGRGTQVLSPESLAAIGWERIHVIAPPEKLMGLRALHVDSRSPDFDANAPTYIRVISGWNETRLVKVQHGPPDS